MQCHQNTQKPQLINRGVRERRRSETHAPVRGVVHGVETFPNRHDNDQTPSQFLDAKET